MKSKSAKTANEIFVELKHGANDPWLAKLANGLAFMAESLDDLHAKIDSIEAGHHARKMEIVDSVEARLKAVGLIK